MTHMEPATLVGDSQVMIALRAEIARIGQSNARVLITGESGAGKEVVARAIYGANGDHGSLFVPVNCGGIPETLLESELFGHVKGSFTGAYRDKPGKLEMPPGSTIFLDEIGEMTLRMQGLLLRYLETGEIQKIGAERTVSAPKVRVIAATNRNLRREMERERFREDLFYRLNVLHVVVPTLRARREDIPILVAHFLAAFTNGRDATKRVRLDALGAPVQAISPEAVAVLQRYAWPGNVRQLRNVVERLVVTAPREVVQPEDLPAEVRTPLVDATPRPVSPAAPVTDELFRKLTEHRESFWTAVYPLYMNHEITKATIRDLIHRALYQARGNYTIVLEMFNMEPREYKRFLNFLRKHECQLPFMEYRQ